MMVLHIFALIIQIRSTLSFIDYEFNYIECIGNQNNSVTVPVCYVNEKVLAFQFNVTRRVNVIIVINYKLI
jgi:hypothetical protein